jgi:hypothetical protein
MTSKGYPKVWLGTCFTPGTMSYKRQNCCPAAYLVLPPMQNRDEVLLLLGEDVDIRLGDAARHNKAISKFAGRWREYATKNDFPFEFNEDLYEVRDNALVVSLSYASPVLSKKYPIVRVGSHRLSDCDPGNTPAVWFLLPPSKSTDGLQVKGLVETDGRLFDDIEEQDDLLDKMILRWEKYAGETGVSFEFDPDLYVKVGERWKHNVSWDERLAKVTLRFVAHGEHDQPDYPYVVFLVPPLGDSREPLPIYYDYLDTPIKDVQPGELTAFFSYWENYARSVGILTHFDKDAFQNNANGWDVVHS